MAVEIRPATEGFSNRTGRPGAAEAMVGLDMMIQISGQQKGSCPGFASSPKTVEGLGIEQFLKSLVGIQFRLGSQDLGQSHPGMEWLVLFQCGCIFQTLEATRLIGIQSILGSQKVSGRLVAG